MEDIQKSIQESLEARKEWVEKSYEENIICEDKTDIQKAKKSPLGTIHVNKYGTWKKVSDTGNSKTDWKRVSKGEANAVKAEPEKKEETVRETKQENPEVKITIPPSYEGQEVKLMQASSMMKPSTFESWGFENKYKSQPLNMQVMNMIKDGVDAGAFTTFKQHTKDGTFTYVRFGKEKKSDESKKDVDKIGNKRDNAIAISNINKYEVKDYGTLLDLYEKLLNIGKVVDQDILDAMKSKLSELYKEKDKKATESKKDNLESIVNINKYEQKDFDTLEKLYSNSIKDGVDQEILGAMKNRLNELSKETGQNKETDQKNRGEKFDFPSWMEDEDKEDFISAVKSQGGDLKIGIELPKPKGNNSSHMQFVYGAHQNSKEQAIENAKNLLTNIFEFRAKNKPKGGFSKDMFSADRLSDKNTAALLDGISKKAVEMYNKGFESQVKKYFGENIASRIEANQLYQSLRRSKLVGGSEIKPADLSKFESLVSLHLK